MAVPAAKRIFRPPHPRGTPWLRRLGLAAHFGPPSTLTFATTHIPMVLLMFVARFEAVRRQRHGAWVVLATAAAIQCGLHAVFPLLTAALLGEHSPGMLTAACLGLPSSIAYVAWVRRDRRLTGRELAAAAVLGTALAAAAIGVLLLH